MSVKKHIGSFLTGTFSTVAGTALGTAATMVTQEPLHIVFGTAAGIVGGLLSLKKRHEIKPCMFGVVTGLAISAIPVLGMRIPAEQTGMMNSHAPHLSAPAID